MDDLRVLFFFYFIEVFVMAVAGLWSFGYKGRLQPFIFVALAQGLLVWLVRGAYRIYQIPYGTHTLILALSMVVVIKLICRVDWGIALGATLVSFSLVVLGSGFSNLLVMQLSLRAADVLNNPWVHVAIGHTETVFLWILLLANRFFGFTLIKTIDG